MKVSFLATFQLVLDHNDGYAFENTICVALGQKSNFSVHNSYF